MFIEDAYELLRQEPPIEDFEPRVARLVALSGMEESICREFLWHEAGHSDVVRLRSRAGETEFQTE